jgi:hypothetical protein
MNYEMNYEGYRVTDAAMTLLARTKELLEWMPVCSEGSSGHQNRIAVERAMKALAHTLAINS